MGVQVCAASEREWRRSVEPLRVSVAMMADEYALGTIQIYVSAVGHHFSMRDWPSPYTCDLFKRTMQGIKRVSGDSKTKKPPIVAEHVAALLGMVVRPGNWTL